MTTSTSYVRAGATDSVDNLLRRVRDGDPAAWEEILRRYGKLVSATVRSFRFQDADVLDAVQMTWLRLAENADRVQFPERLGGWLATTARRECLRILRQAKPAPDLIDVVLETVADPSWAPSSALSTPTPCGSCESSSASCRRAGGPCCGRCSPIISIPTRRSPVRPEFRPAGSGPPGRGPCSSCGTSSTSTSRNRESGDDDRYQPAPGAWGCRTPRFVRLGSEATPLARGTLRHHDHHTPALSRGAPVPSDAAIGRSAAASVVGWTS
jgi:hypothetical protein